MINTTEPGDIEFERDPSKVDPAIEKKIPKPALPEREHYSETDESAGTNPKDEPGLGQTQRPADRQTGQDPDIERAQQPVTAHQDRRRK